MPTLSRRLLGDLRAPLGRNALGALLPALAAQLLGGLVLGWRIAVILRLLAGEDAHDFNGVAITSAGRFSSLVRSALVIPLGVSWLIPAHGADCALQLLRVWDKELPKPSHQERP